jgi:hypothetical protein
MAGKKDSYKEDLLALFAQGDAEQAAEQVRVQEIEVRSTQQALMLATARTLAADEQQEIADKTYAPAFLNLDRYRDWEVEEDIAKAARRKARTAAWEATRKFLALNR